MLFISNCGIVDAERIEVAICPEIERGPMDKVNGIVVHQTDAPTIESTFNSYKNKGANGAHFLIDKSGKIYQTASVYKITHHVGWLKSRCLIKRKCTPVDIQEASKLKIHPLSRHEIKKEWPDRFPANHDSIGIELVGESFGPKGKEIYEKVTAQQNSSLRWLISELIETLNVPTYEIYRHPDISYKNETEASTAIW